MDITHKGIVELFESNIMEGVEVGSQDYCKTLDMVGETVLKHIMDAMDIPYLDNGHTDPLDFIVAGHYNHYGVELKTTAFNKQERINMIRGRSDGVDSRYCLKRKYDECKRRGVAPITVAIWFKQDTGRVHFLYRPRFKSFYLPSMWSGYRFLEELQPIIASPSDVRQMLYDAWEF